jgi:hypothetical protein
MYDTFQQAAFDSNFQDWWVHCDQFEEMRRGWFEDDEYWEQQEDGSWSQEEEWETESEQEEFAEPQTPQRYDRPFADVPPELLRLERRPERASPKPDNVKRRLSFDSNPHPEILAFATSSDCDVVLVSTFSPPMLQRKGSPNNLCNEPCIFENVRRHLDFGVIPNTTN